MKKNIYTVRLEFTEPLLGSASNNPAIHEEFIASKAPTLADAAEEVASLTQVTEEIEKAMTVFPHNDSGLHLWDYQVRGFFKETIGVLIELGDVKDLSKWQHKRAVDSLLFISPRRVPLYSESGAQWKKAPNTCQRPLRASTMQGDRVALASSEELPAGTWTEFDITLLSGDNKKTKLAVLKQEHLIACLEYGILKGFGQWRSGGYGRFTYTIKERVQEPPVKAAA